MTETRRPPRRTAGAPPAQRDHAAQQRRRILDAAERCFIDNGFHAASMACIAATAGVSAGLIYRYFEHKSAIVQAIIARHLETEGTADIDQLNSPAELCAALLRAFECWRRGDDPSMNAALLLELTAASTRDPHIARAVRGKDRVIGQAVERAVRRIARAQGVRLSAAAVRGRSEILLCLVAGLASRAVREPTLTRRALEPALRSILGALLGK